MDDYLFPAPLPYSFYFRMSQNYSTTVVFADVAGSSKLYKQVGDKEANQRISDLLDRLIASTKTHHGIVIKTIGDELMCHFPDPYDAYLATIKFQQIGEETLPIRVGMAYGQVIEKGADIFGKAVNDAAAVAKIARGCQIITTEKFKSLLLPEPASRLTIFDDVKLKGDSKSTLLYRIDWESSQHSNNSSSSDHTVIISNISDLQNQLILSFNNEQGENTVLTLNAMNVPIHIGRDSISCKLVIATQQASRDHCHIDYQYGKFVLVDHSTNGTYVKNLEGQQVYLRREELPLLGSGEISLGEKAAENQYTIKFST